MSAACSTLTGLQWGIYDAYKVYVGLPTTGSAPPPEHGDIGDAADKAQVSTASKARCTMLIRHPHNSASSHIVACYRASEI